MHLNNVLTYSNFLVIELKFGLKKLTGIVIVGVVVDATDYGFAAVAAVVAVAAAAVLNWLL